jgi:membrane protein implicated in regulation of membrane protease activity
VNGELWRARSLDGPIHVGEAVRVERVGDELVLEVSRAIERAAAETS